MSQVFEQSMFLFSPNLRRVFPEHVFLAVVRGDPERVVVAAEVKPGRAGGGAGVAEEPALGEDVPVTEK